jgi:hypothetical protein
MTQLKDLLPERKHVLKGHELQTFSLMKMKFSINCVIFHFDIQGGAKL